jgi:methionyl aminopeptidase
MIVLKTPGEIRTLDECNRIVIEVLDEVEKAIAPGVTTLELDEIAERGARARGARPAFKGYRGFPKSLCASVNCEVVHGIPSKERRLKEGDIVGCDFGAVFGGFVGDAARTIRVGKVSPLADRLIKAAERALHAARAAALPGGRLGDMSAAVQEVVEAGSFSVIREFVGHGVGRELHEDPQVPNYGARGSGVRLRAGMVLAIEPMIAAGNWDVEIAENGWTAVTKDRSLSAHAEHSIAITEGGPVILGLGKAR